MRIILLTHLIIKAIYKNIVYRPSAYHFWRAHQENFIFHFIDFDVFEIVFSVKADPFFPLL